MSSNQHIIYLFSGLGADERLFQLLDFGDHKVKFVPWIKPLKKESLSTYAKRLSESEQVVNENAILIGLSLGGMIAVEVAKYISVKKVILISSAKTRKEIPFYFRWLGWLNIYKLIPVKLLKRGGIVMSWIFGAQSRREKDLLKQIVQDTDEWFVQWAIGSIINWDNERIPEEVVHIHGDKDYLLPLRNVKADKVIKGGGHFMIINRVKEVQEFLKQETCIKKHK